jgi:hypothetical protein
MKSRPKTIGYYASLLSMLLIAGVIYWWTIRHGTPPVDADTCMREIAHTSDIESPAPFSPGIRVWSQQPHASNVAVAPGSRAPGFKTTKKGLGYARAFRVESVQPEIVNNDLGLVIGIQIDDRTINGQPATESLSVDLDDITPKSAGAARWIMCCSLTGRFIDYKTELTRAHELGAQMPPFITAAEINTHFLLVDRLVDTEDHDSTKIYLAKDDYINRVCQSDYNQTDGTDRSGISTIDNSGTVFQINTPAAGFIYVNLDDPFNGTMLIESAIRSDGKSIKAANVWFSQTPTGLSR